MDLSIFLVYLSFASSCMAEKTAQEAVKPNEIDLKNVITKVDENIYNIGGVILNKTTREFSLKAEVEQAENVIEYVLTTKKGKIHETLFSTAIDPLHLNLCFKLLGYKKSLELFKIITPDELQKERFHQSDPETKKAARFNVFVSWIDKGKKHNYHVNNLIQNSLTNKPALVQPYVYCGSFLTEGRFQARLEGNHIAVYTNQGAIGNFSNKGHDNDTIWLPNTKLIPPMGMTVTLTFKKHQ